MALPGEIDIVPNCPDCGAPMPVKVCMSGAGYYIGQWCNIDGPWNRLSVRYWRTRKEAQDALDSNNWVRRDTEYHGR